jgi:hypothetical protein
MRDGPSRQESNPALANPHHDRRLGQQLTIGRPKQLLDERKDSRIRQVPGHASPARRLILSVTASMLSGSVWT